MTKAKFILSLFALLNLLEQVQCELELDYEFVVYGTQDDEAILKCDVDTDLSIKQVVWYKDTLSSAEETLYYYEPASSIDQAYLMENRVTRLNTSLSIIPVDLDDEGWYTCRAAVWNTSDFRQVKERSVRMKLIVYVRPNQVQLSAIATGNNMTLVCKALDARPAAEITWLKTQSSGESEEMVSEKSNEESRDKLTDVTGFLYYTLSASENTVKISCVVNHPNTGTTLYKNVTMVSPFIQNAVKVYIAKLDDEVPYSVIGNQNDDPDNPAGLVKISAEPGLQVPTNSSVVLRASAPGVFPEPSFLWWKANELQVVYSGSEVTIEKIDSDVTYNVLAQNPVGKVVLGVPLTVTHENQIGSSSTPPSTTDGPESLNKGGLNGGLIAVIVVGSLLFCLLVALTIWYLTCKKPPNEDIPSKKTKKQSHRYTDETDGFIPPSKPLMRTVSTQTLERSRDHLNKRPSGRIKTSEC